jgi:hypothetical protein
MTRVVPMTDWFARPVLHVTEVEASILIYVDRLGFAGPRRYEEDGKAHEPTGGRCGSCEFLRASEASVALNGG